MFARPLRQRFTLLSTLLLMSAVSLSGCSSAQAEEAVAASAANLSVEADGQTESACGSSCYGRCWSCILGVCENTCQ